MVLLGDGKYYGLPEDQRRKALEQDKLAQLKRLAQTPKEFVPPYQPDGKDHSLLCDPTYELLVKLGTVYPPTYTLQLDSQRVWEHTQRCENPPGEYSRVQQLARDWTQQHQHQYRMNNMSQEEYTRLFLEPYMQHTSAKWKLTFEEKKRKEEAWEAYRKKYGTAPDAPKESCPDEFNEMQEFDRLQVISEYGW